MCSLMAVSHRLAVGAEVGDGARVGDVSGGFLDAVVRARVSFGLSSILGACYVCQPVTNFRQL
jgi:hypothetical protein